MMPKPNPERTDHENPEWTEADFRRAVPFSRLPAELRQTLAGAGELRGESIPVRVAAETVAAFKEKGPDWEARINQVLRQWLARNCPDEPAQESSN